MRLLGHRKTLRACAIADCQGRATVRIVSPADPHNLLRVCRKCSDELESVHGWEAVR